MRCLKLRSFARDAAKAGLATEALAKAAEEICAGSVEARLGGFLVKKRVAKRGGGKSGGFRLIVAVKEGERLIFLHVFEKPTKRTFLMPSKPCWQTLALPICR